MEKVVVSLHKRENKGWICSLSNSIQTFPSPDTLIDCIIFSFWNSDFCCFYMLHVCFSGHESLFFESIKLSAVIKFSSMFILNSSKCDSTFSPKNTWRMIMWHIGKFWLRTFIFTNAMHGLVFCHFDLWKALKVWNSSFQF